VDIHSQERPRLSQLRLDSILAEIRAITRNKAEDHIRLGKLLFQAFGEKLPQKDWADYDLGIDSKTAADLRTLSQDPIMSDPKYIDAFPDKRDDIIGLWKLLQYLRKWNEESRFIDLINTGVIEPNIYRRQIRNLLDGEKWKHSSKRKTKSVQMKYDAKITDCKWMIGDVLEQLKLLPDESVQCIVMSPPYYEYAIMTTWKGKLA
jgi:hypothetical protein